ncbi:MAG TPA: YtfJ family protein [Pseudomonadales bacterium]|nr:YtfJ family protein [Pseudomonadales bacterium]
MKKFSSAVLVSALLASSSLWAANIEIGKTVPDVKIVSEGEINLDEKHEKVTGYTEWGTDQLKGKVRTIQAIAGRTSAKKLNQAFMEEITASKFDRTKYQTTTIINLDDKIPATGFVVKGKAESSKKEFWWSSMVVDEKGKAASVWGLKPESSAIIILDKQGKVVFFKEGELSQDERAQALNLIKTELAKTE